MPLRRTHSLFTKTRGGNASVVDLQNGFSAVGGERTMLVCAGISGPVVGQRYGADPIRGLRGRGMMDRGAVSELAVLGASYVLYEHQMAALGSHEQQGCNGQSSTEPENQWRPSGLMANVRHRRVGTIAELSSRCRLHRGPPGFVCSSHRVQPGIESPAEGGKERLLRMRR